MDRRTEVQSFLWRCVNEFKKGKNKGRGKKGELKLRRTENRMWTRYYVRSHKPMIIKILVVSILITDRFHSGRNKIQNLYIRSHIFRRANLISQAVTAPVR